MTDRNKNYIEMSPGVLNREQMNRLIQESFIRNPGGIDNSAIDLTLGSRAWKLSQGMRPSSRVLTQIRRDQEDLQPGEDGSFELTKGNVYLFELKQILYLPKNISGRASGKSTVGRIDVITRLLTNDSSEYDIVPENYAGELFLLIVPQTFNIRVAPGDSLNQLRLFSGPQNASIIKNTAISDYGTPFWHRFKSRSDTEYDDWQGILNKREVNTGDPLCFDLTVDLGDPKSGFVYKAKDHCSKTSLALKKKSYNAEDFFEKIDIEKDGLERWVILDAGKFYIMKSRERLAIPADVAVEVIAISERIGDIRIHYAGFAHPMFGRGERNEKDNNRLGTPLIFEVRATDMNTKLYNESTLARIQLFRMSSPEYQKDSSPDYEKQELKLSKIFKSES